MRHISASASRALMISLASAPTPVQAASRTVDIDQDLTLRVVSQHLVQTGCELLGAGAARARGVIDHVAAFEGLKRNHACNDVGLVVTAGGARGANHTECPWVDVVARWAHVQGHGQVEGWGGVTGGGGGDCFSEEVPAGCLGLREAVGGC